jgi:hypothetical protein
MKPLGRFGLAVGLAAGLVFVGARAHAADLYEPGTQPLPPPAAWKLAITPRVWFAWEDDSFFQSSTGTQQSQETYFYPFYGGSVSAISPGGTAYSLTILHGEGEAAVRGVNQDCCLLAFATTADFNQTVPNQIFISTLAVGNGGSFYEGTVKNERTDVEAIAQIPVSEGFTGTIGARYINFQRNENDAVTFPVAVLQADTLGNRFSEIVNVTFPNQKFSLEQNFWLGELGFGLTRPANQSGSIQFFGNMTGMFGYADVTEFKTPSGFFAINPDVTGTRKGQTGIFNLTEDDLQGAVIGVDTNAGVAFRVAQSVLLSARYRLFYLSAPQVKFDKGDYLIHGPEVNATFTW